MKQFRSLCLLAVATAVLATAPAAQAAPVLYANFCPGNTTCPDGITEASLAFYEEAGTADTNDYNLLVEFTGTAAAPMYLDEFQFNISGVTTPDGYSSLPTVTSAPSDGSPWTPFFSNISASPGSCTASNNAGQGVCVQSGPGDASNYGAVVNSSTLEFWLYVNLAGDFVLTPDTAVNLRAQFLNQNGSNGGILSPDFNQEPPPENVPEPTSLVLLGLGLLGAGVARRRKQL